MSELFWIFLREVGFYLVSVVFIWAFYLLLIVRIFLILEVFRWVKERIVLPQRDLDLVILEVLFESDGDLVESQVLYRRRKTPYLFNKTCVWIQKHSSKHLRHLRIQLSAHGC